MMDFIDCGLAISDCRFGRLTIGDLDCGLGIFTASLSIVQLPGPANPNPKSQIPNPKSQIPNPKSQLPIPNLNPQIPNLNPQSAIEAIRNPQSSIRNQSRRFMPAGHRT